MTDDHVLIDNVVGTLRVSIDPDGRFDIVDFTIPVEDARFICRKAEQEHVPTWVIEAVCLLRMAEPQSVVKDIGFKVHDTLYYLTNPKGKT